MERKIVPTLTRKQAQSGIIDIEGWKNFAERITKNPFVKTFLLERDGNCCQWCNGSLKEATVIHHINYAHTCTYNTTVRIPAPTKGNSKKTRIIPDCKNCKADNNERFISCMNKLALVHGYCNKIISQGTLKKES